jgi:putative membrane protein
MRVGPMRAVLVGLVVASCAGLLWAGLAVSGLAQGYTGPGYSAQGAPAQGVPGPAPGGPGQFGPGPYGPRHFGARPFGPRPFGPWGIAAGGLFFLLRALLFVGLLLIIWRLLGTRSVWQRFDAATQILRERYARGEISEDEYRKRLTTLT